MSTTTADLCGHRWLGDYRTPGDHLARHRCDLPAGHHQDGPIPRPCRCRCGATTTRGDAK